MNVKVNYFRGFIPESRECGTGNEANYKSVKVGVKKREVQ